MNIFTIKDFLTAEINKAYKLWINNPARTGRISPGMFWY